MPEMINWTGIVTHKNEAFSGLPSPIVQQEPVSDRKFDSTQSQNVVKSTVHFSAFQTRENWKPISGMDHEPHTVMLKDANLLPKHVLDGENHTSCFYLFI